MFQADALRSERLMSANWPRLTGTSMVFLRGPEMNIQKIQKPNFTDEYTWTQNNKLNQQCLKYQEVVIDH